MSDEVENLQSKLCTMEVRVEHLSGLKRKADEVYNLNVKLSVMEGTMEAMIELLYYLESENSNKKTIE